MIYEGVVITRQILEKIRQILEITRQVQSSPGVVQCAIAANKTLNDFASKHSRTSTGHQADFAAGVSVSMSKRDSTGRAMLEIEAKWAIESEERIDAVERGDLKTVDGPSALRNLRARFSHFEGTASVLKDPRLPCE